MLGIYLSRYHPASSYDDGFSEQQKEEQVGMHVRAECDFGTDSCWESKAVGCHREEKLIIPAAAAAAAPAAAPAAAAAAAGALPLQVYTFEILEEAMEECIPGSRTNTWA